MTATVLLGFIAACVVLAVTPGPNMALIIANTLAGGLRAGLVTLAGCLTGLSVLVLVATVGMTSVMALMSAWFDVIRWVGALYLIALGLLQLRQYWRGRHRAVGRSERAEAGRSSRAVIAAKFDDGLPSLSPAYGADPASAGWRYVQAVMVSLSNPKVLLFLGAFFPQFVHAGSPPGPQLAMLGVAFIVTLATVDLCYTLAIARARATVDMGRLRILDAVSGVLLLAGGLVLATARRP